MKHTLLYHFRLLHHYFLSRSKFDIHSPFAYKIYSEIIKDNTDYPEYNKLINQTSEGNTSLFNAKTPPVPSHSRGGAGEGSFVSISRCMQRIINIVQMILRCSASRRFIKDCRLIFRLSRYFKPKTILICGTIDEMTVSHIESGAPGSNVICIHDKPGLIADPGLLDMVFISGDLPGNIILDYFSRIMQHIHNDSVLIFYHIHGSKEMHEVWNEIKDHSSVIITIDLFNLGLVFFKEELTKEDFILCY